MNALITPELLRRLEQVQMLAARRAKSSLKGERRSRARGLSVEFADMLNDRRHRDALAAHAAHQRVVHIHEDMKRGS